jgi:lycopene cyclase domain-containing protein
VTNGWRQASYAAMLAFVLLGTLPLHRFYGLSVLRQPLRLLAAIVPVAVVFVTWDLMATAAGHWSFDPAQTLGVRWWGLPLEEYAFFVVIPLAGILTFEAVGVARVRRGARTRSSVR